MIRILRISPEPPAPPKSGPWALNLRILRILWNLSRFRALHLRMLRIIRIARSPPAPDAGAWKIRTMGPQSSDSSDSLEPVAFSCHPSSDDPDSSDCALPLVSRKSRAWDLNRRILRILWNVSRLRVVNVRMLGILQIARSLGAFELRPPPPGDHMEHNNVYPLPPGGAYAS